MISARSAVGSCSFDPVSPVLSPTCRPNAPKGGGDRVAMASQPQESAAFFPSATTRRSASLTASAEPKCDQSSGSMATISPTLRLAWCPRPGRRRNRGSLISGISSRDVALGSLGFFNRVVVRVARHRAR